MTSTRLVIGASYGNDSLALIQVVFEEGWRNVDVVYSDTGWAARWWPERVARMETWVRSLGFRPHIVASEGMRALVDRKKGWPRQGIQFCTEELKIKPAIDWLEKNDPEKLSIRAVGVRREESENRASFPVWRASNPADGGRPCYAPLASFTVEQRDAALHRAGFEPLPHRSKECFPCINSNRADLLVLAEDEQRIAEIEQIENDMGFTGKGKPKTMFRPYRYMGATGIREVVRWAKSDRGKFSLDDGTGGGNCDGGYCGT